MKRVNWAEGEFLPGKDGLWYRRGVDKAKGIKHLLVSTNPQGLDYDSPMNGVPRAQAFGHMHFWFDGENLSYNVKYFSRKLLDYVFKNPSEVNTWGKDHVYLPQKNYDGSGNNGDSSLFYSPEMENSIKELFLQEEMFKVADDGIIEMPKMKIYQLRYGRPFKADEIALERAAEKIREFSIELRDLINQIELDCNNAKRFGGDYVYNALQMASTSIDSIERIVKSLEGEAEYLLEKAHQVRSIN